MEEESKRGNGIKDNVLLAKGTKNKKDKCKITCSKSIPKEGSSRQRLVLIQARGTEKLSLIVDDSGIDLVEDVTEAKEFGSKLSWPTQR